MTTPSYISAPSGKKLGYFKLSLKVTLASSCTVASPAIPDNVSVSKYKLSILATTTMSSDAVISNVAASVKEPNRPSKEMTPTSVGIMIVDCVLNEASLESVISNVVLSDSNMLKTSRAC